MLKMENISAMYFCGPEVGIVYEMVIGKETHELIYHVNIIILCKYPRNTLVLLIATKCSMLHVHKNFIV
jgi:hypothetical protein